MNRLAALATAVVLVAGCGGDANGGTDRPPAAGAHPREYAQAERAMARDDFDGAIALLERLPDDPEAQRRLAAHRREAARKTLANARRKLAKAPRAALSQALVAQRYHATPEGRAFVREARRALARFRARELDDVDQR